jgi:predicted nucleotidyltransferase/predicted DNA-binding protein
VPRTAKVVAFSTTPEMAEEIDRLAAEQGRTRSDLLREAVRCYRAESIRSDSSSAAEAPTVYSPRPSTPSLPGLARVLARRSEIAAACAEASVARLWVFGSAVRDDFDPTRSDLDFLVEFLPDVVREPWLGELTRLSDALSEILGGSVDLSEAGGLRNPYVRAAVDAERVLVYEQP